MFSAEGHVHFFQRGTHLTRRKEQVHRILPGSAYRVPAGLDLMESTRHTSSWAATRAYGGLRRADVRVALLWVGPLNALESLARMSGSRLGGNDGVLRAGTPEPPKSNGRF